MSKGRWGVITRVIGIGWYIGLSIALPAIGGRWLDRTLDTRVFFTVLGIGIGVIIAFVGTYYYIYPAMKGRDK